MKPVLELLLKYPLCVLPAQKLLVATGAGGNLTLPEKALGLRFRFRVKGSGFRD
jgi:hypothetical protein